MQKQDLQQIKQLLKEEFKENNKNLVTKEDLKQIFKENNKKIFKKIDDKIDEVMLINKEEFERVDKRFERVDKRFDEVDKKFNEVDKRFDKADKRFNKVDDKCDNIYGRICDFTDNELKTLELDMDKVKYIHLDEWDKLPPTVEISKTLVEHKLKKKR